MIHADKKKHGLKFFVLFFLHRADEIGKNFFYINQDNKKLVKLYLNSSGSVRLREIAKELIYV